MKYPRITNDFFSTVWAIMPEKLDVMIEFINLKSEGFNIKHDSDTREPDGRLGVIPVYGVISQRMTMLSYFYGGTSTEQIKKQINAYINDSSISKIILDIDSPGGSVYGIVELSDFIYHARSIKPIISVANSLAASAAYWIGSAASEFVITPGGEVGSIGVIMAHQTKIDNEVKTTIIKAGKYKDEGNPYEELSKDAKEFYQSRVESYYKMFIDDVAKNRGVDKKTVLNDFGQGRVFGAEEALKAGMVDKIGTMDYVLENIRPSIKTNRKVLRNAEVELLNLTS